MDSREKQDEKNKRVGWLISVSVQLFLLILFYFLIAWKAPFPPLPEYGIELGFTTSAGAPPQPITSSDDPVEEAPAQTEEIIQENTPVETPAENQENAETETAEVEESETPIEAEEASGNESEIEDENTAEEVVSEVKTEDPTEPDNPNNEVKQEEEVVEEPTIDDRAIYGNQGTETGDSEGASLALAGWIWDFKPVPDDKSEETGKIVYKIVVDQDGYLVKIETITSTVSPAVERKYREAVEKLTFSKTSEYKPAALSNGTLTFIIKAR